MKNRITLFLTSFLCFNLFGQTPFKDLDIKQFQYADAKLKTFDIGFNQFGQDNKRKYDDYLIFHDKSFNFNGSLTARFFNNSRKFQKTGLFTANLNMGKFNNAGGDLPWSTQANLGWNAQSRFYIGNQFLEISPDLNFNYNKSESLDLKVGVAFKRGSGRIEPVSDVYMVRWMIKDLEENGVDVSGLNQENLFDIANKLNVINNYRIFDNRRQLKRQIKDMTLAMEEHLSVPMDKLDLYGIVFDNYTRAFVGNRFEGSRKAFVARPFGQSLTRYEDILGRFTKSGFGIDLYGEFVKSKNTGLNTQHSVEIHGGAGYSSNSLESRSENVYPFLDGKYQFDFFPNSRTTLSAFVDASYRFVNYKILSSTYKPDSQSFLNSNFGFSANYFINYKTRIQANLNFSYIDNYQIENYGGDVKLTSFSNNIRFLHSIL